MDIFNVIRDKSCALNLTAKSKEEGLQKISQLLAGSIPDLNPDQVYRALQEREELGSTGFEEGIAIPHAKVEGLDDFYMSIAISKRGVPFDSVDGKKSRLFFTIIGPEERTQEHLQILAQISRISRNPNARREMFKAKNSTVLKEAFLRFVTSKAPGIEEKAKNKLLILVLYEKRYFDDILELFLERGIRGVNVLESSGIHDQLSAIPLFSDFFNFLGERSDVSKTIMTVLAENEVKEIVEDIEALMGDLSKHTGAMVMVMDLFYSKGSLEV